MSTPPYQDNSYSAGIIMFMAEFGLICWIKFWTASQAAAWVATAILIPVAFIFLGFALHFHR